MVQMLKNSNSYPTVILYFFGLGVEGTKLSKGHFTRKQEVVKSALLLKNRLLQLQRLRIAPKCYISPNSPTEGLSGRGVGWCKMGLIVAASFMKCRRKSPTWRHTGSAEIRTKLTFELTYRPHCETVEIVWKVTIREIVKSICQQFGTVQHSEVYASPLRLDECLM